jgi:hypothetical protein
VYSYNYFGTEEYIVRSAGELPGGRATVGLEFKRMSEHRGRAYLLVEDECVGEVDIPRMIPIWFDHDSAVRAGTDGSLGVSHRYTAPFRFTGILERVVVEVDGEEYDDPEGEFAGFMARQ